MSEIIDRPLSVRANEVLLSDFVRCVNGDYSPLERYADQVQVKEFPLLSYIFNPDRQLAMLKNGLFNEIWLPLFVDVLIHTHRGGADEEELVQIFAGITGGRFSIFTASWLYENVKIAYNFCASAFGNDATAWPQILVDNFKVYTDTIADKFDIIIRAEHFHEDIVVLEKMTEAEVKKYNVAIERYNQIKPEFTLEFFIPVINEASRLPLPFPPEYTSYMIYSELTVAEYIEYSKAIKQ